MVETYTPEQLRLHLRRYCVLVGGQKTWADKHGVSEQYLSDVLRGRREPGAKILRAMKLKRVVGYVHDEPEQTP